MLKKKATINKLVTDTWEEGPNLIQLAANKNS